MQNRSREEYGDGRWYSVPEAAAYLGVSEPTIFRWMKDGRLTYYKVGRATRFSRACLDAVIEKRCGDSEACAAGRCIACGQDTTVRVSVEREDSLRMYLDDTSAPDAPPVSVNARACPACGFVQLYADPERLQDMLPAEASFE